jgi:hypothetical protein
VTDPILMASTCLAAAQSTEGQESAFYLARARLALEEAKEKVRQTEIIVRAREHEAARIAAMSATAVEATP